jgi:hypothetical protein
MYAISGGEPGLTSYELEVDDAPEVVVQIFQYIEEFLALPENPFTVSLIEPISEQQVDIEVNPFKYLTKRHCNKCLTQLRKLI